tara:strand:+ start:1914 stop:3236 length:1323 start_codon:yes stop_codon:yes gene_type:complete
MNINSIITEWTYRLPKGYPDSEQDYQVLHEVLNEMTNLSENDRKAIVRKASGLYEQEDEENNIQSIEINEDEVVIKVDEIDEINESSYDLLLNEGYTKDDLITVIKTSPLSDKLISYISRLIDSANSQTSALNGLQNRNFDNTTAKAMFDKSVEFESYKQLQGLVIGQAPGIDFDSLGTDGNLQPFIDTIGFSKEYADWLYNYRPAIGGVNVGAGENMLRVILKGGYVPTKGDVGAEGIEIELKATQTKTSGFRMRGQSGYGSGYDIALTMFNAIQRAYSDNLPDNFPDVRSDNTIQLYFKSGKESLADTYLKDLIMKRLLTRSQIIDIYSQALKLFYKNYNGDIKSEIADPGINTDGTFNVSELFPRLAALEFKYYADTEPWDVFMSLNYQKDYLILYKNASIDKLTDIFKNKFNIGAPNTKPKATSQDSMTAVQLKTS